MFLELLVQIRLPDPIKSGKYCPIVLPQRLRTSKRRTTSPLGAIVTYMAKDGELLTYVVEYYENDHKIFWSTEELEWVRQQSDTLPDNIKRRPNGLEKRAVTKEGRPILKWW